MNVWLLIAFSYYFTAQSEGNLAHFASINGEYSGSFTVEFGHILNGIDRAIRGTESIEIDCESPFDAITEEGTQITSPKYPNNYDNDLDCQLTINFEPDQIVSVTFESFDVELEDRCEWDYLAIHDGNSTESPMIGYKLCGKGPTGTTIKSTGNQMTLHFFSDEIETRTGFKLTTKAEAKGKRHSKVLKSLRK